MLMKRRAFETRSQRDARICAEVEAEWVGSGSGHVGTSRLQSVYHLPQERSTDRLPDDQKKAAPDNKRAPVVGLRVAMDEEQEDQLRGAVALFVGRLEMQELLAALAALDQAGFNVPTLPCPAL
jgi:hypothetical protein